jgi:hypothetical protein
VSALRVATPACRGLAPGATRTAADRDLIGRLDDTATWPGAAASLLARLGFRLVGPSSLGGGGSHLLVALRDRPTLDHFDPEALAYFASDGDRAALTTLDRRAVLADNGAASRRVLWGHVHVVDRLPVENRFLTFGGELRVAPVDSKLTVLDLHSPAPIVRWGGHSQVTDTLTDAIGAFFARLMVPIDFVPGAESRIDALAPEVLYHAFLLDWRARAARAERHGAEPGPLAGWAGAACRRACIDAEARRSAEALLAELPGGSSARQGPIV